MNVMDDRLIYLTNRPAKSIVASISILFGLIFLAGTARAISVSITDNVVVLDESSRSAAIQLLSMTPSPVEFEVRATELPPEVQDGRELLRWAPERTVVPANRGRPLRMVFRPPADLSAGEYVVRLAVQSREVDYEPDFGNDDDAATEDGENRLQIGVAIQPVLPVTIYIRHKVESPKLVVNTFQPTPEAQETHGYFNVSKRPEAISYIGEVALVGEVSNTVYTSGRLRMGQTVNEKRVRVPRRDGDEQLTEAICLHLWPQFPAEGEPEQKVCQ